MKKYFTYPESLVDSEISIGYIEKRMKNILVIYHTDLDGAASAACVGLYHKADKVRYKLFNYGWDLSPEDLKGYDIVYAVDVSFGQSHPWVYSIPGLIWIDHHKTALEYETLNLSQNNIPGLRRIGRGACELTWEYLFPGVVCPDLIQILSTYDVWDKDRMDWEMVREIEVGAKDEFGISPEAIISFIVQGRSVQELRERGQIILGYLFKANRGKLTNSGIYLPDVFGGLRGLALCTADFSSMTFDSYYDPNLFDFVMPFQIVPKDSSPGEFYVRISLYTESPLVDVSLIAKSYGGGGHRGAAGAEISLPQLLEILGNGISLKAFLGKK